MPRHPPCALVSLTCPLALRQSISIMLESLFGFSLAIHPPCSSMDVSKILRRFRAQYTNSSCLASHSSLFLYSVFKVRLRRAFRVVCTTLLLVTGFGCLLFAPTHSATIHLTICSVWNAVCLRRSWWAQMDSNHRPHAYQACALTT